jgi:hypothetical protein
MQPTIEQWKLNQDLVRMADKVVNTNEWRRMRECLIANRPRGVLPFGSTASDAGNSLGYVRCWMDCIATIESMAELGKRSEPPVATFSDKNNNYEHSNSAST